MAVVSLINPSNIFWHEIHPMFIGATIIAIETVAPGYLKDLL